MCILTAVHQTQVSYAWLMQLPHVTKLWQSESQKTQSKLSKIIKASTKTTILLGNGVTFEFGLLCPTYIYVKNDSVWFEKKIFFHLIESIIKYVV